MPAAGTTTLHASLMDADAMRRTIARMAHQIHERNPDPRRLLLVGLLTRGVPLAERLRRELERITQADISSTQLDITPYRDDRRREREPGRDSGGEAPRSTEGADVVLVDDVLYTGRTVRAALDALVDLGRPSSVQLAVLIDRGHRELPIRPDYVGKNVPSARNEEVRVLLTETDGVDQVVVAATNEEGVQ